MADTGLVRKRVRAAIEQDASFRRSVSTRFWKQPPVSTTRGSSIRSATAAMRRSDAVRSESCGKDPVPIHEWVTSGVAPAPNWS